jgi:AcrR family transcriptional regulator
MTHLFKEIGMPQKRLPAEERKKQILKCAVKVFARTNYQSTRVADIAAEAGISEAMIYKHFSSKNAIYLDVLKHMSTRILTFWKEEIEKEPDAYQALRNMGITYFRRMSRHPDELKVQFKAIAEVGNPEIADRLHQDHQNYMNLIRKVIKKGIREGSFRRNVDTVSLGFLFDGMGILMNMMHLLSFGDKFNEKTAAKIIDHLLESIKV